MRALTLISVCATLLCGCYIPREEPNRTNNNEIANGTNIADRQPIVVPPPSNTASTSKQLESKLPASAVETLRIQSGAGKLTIVGTPGVDSVAAVGNIYAQARTLAEAERLRDEIQIRFNQNDRQRPTLNVTDPLVASSNENYSVDLTITLPPNIHVIIDDKGGDVHVESVKKGVSILQANGTVKVMHVSGGVDVSNSGPATELTFIDGRISARDGAGDLMISNISGNLDLTGGGGKLKVRNVDGNVVARDNAEGIDITGVTGDLTMHGIQPGVAKIKQVEGSITFPSE